MFHIDRSCRCIVRRTYAQKGMGVTLGASVPFSGGHFHTHRCAAPFLSD
jgi:hypothetical protein